MAAKFLALPNNGLGQDLLVQKTYLILSLSVRCSYCSVIFFNTIAILSPAGNFTFIHSWHKKVLVR